MAGVEKAGRREIWVEVRGESTENVLSSHWMPSTFAYMEKSKFFYSPKGKR